MNIHEYQAKSLLREMGVSVPSGDVAGCAEEAVAVAKRLPDQCWVVKAQIHAGGRGKAGGVSVCRSLAEVEAAANGILCRHLVTGQTVPEGKTVSKVLVEQGVSISRELYLSVVLDRSHACLSVMASSDGGMDIETVSAADPERVLIERADLSCRLWPFQLRRLMLGMGLTGNLERQGRVLVQKLLKFAAQNDVTLLEINPLAVTNEGTLLALDAKMNFDDSAIKRHPEIAAMRDPEEMDAVERLAQEKGINYVRLQGNVGTMVNGAGLAMATIDAIKHAGAAPANFLDIGGGADEKTVAAGLSIIMADSHVRCILVNIFGGILRCDVVAQGIVNAVYAAGCSLPLVIRMEGTNVEEGWKILDESGIMFERAGSLSDAARKAAELAEEDRK